MAKTIKFKTLGNQINIGGRIIAGHNLTEEVYDELIRIAPSHADLFEVIEEPDVKSASKPKKSEE